MDPAALARLLTPEGWELLNQLPPYSEDTALRLAEGLRPWSMAEVFAIGCAVSLVKIADLAHVSLGPAFWMFAALVVVTVAQDRDGEVVAYTELSVPTDGKPQAYQWGTLVDPAHRGRRLGLAVKVANHRLLQERMPGLEEVLTFNAEVNDHMIAVNEALGFVPTARGAQFQKRL